MPDAAAQPERKEYRPMNLVVCHDTEAVYSQMEDVVRELKAQGHDINLMKSVVHVKDLMDMLGNKRFKSDADLPTDIIMDVSGGNGEPAAHRVLEWFRDNHPGAPLPTINFLSLEIEMAIIEAKMLRQSEAAVLAGAIDPYELFWLRDHVMADNKADHMPPTNTLRRVLNERLDTGFALDQGENPHRLKSINISVAKSLRAMEATVNESAAADYARGEIAAEEAIERMRPELTAMSRGLQNTLAENSAPIDAGIKSDIGFYGASGPPQKGMVVFSTKAATMAAVDRKNPILVMHGYDPAIIPLLANRTLRGLVVTSTYMASHLKLLCETYGVTGLFGAAPEHIKLLRESFNEEAEPERAPYFEGDAADIGGHEIRRGQDILIGLEGNGLVLHPPEGLETKRPDLQPVEIGDQFKVKTMLRAFAEFFAQQGEAARGIKANVNSIDAQFVSSAGIGLVRTEQMVVTNSNALTNFKSFLFRGDDETCRSFIEGIRYKYDDSVKQLRHGPVKVRLFDFVHEELLGKEEQKRFLEEYGRLDIHGGAALETWPRLYREQVRALFDSIKATTRFSGTLPRPLEIMMPAVRTEQDVLAIKQIVAEEADGAYLDRDTYKFGVMIETLDACKNIEAIAPHCDFISFGTNDLTQQYTGMARGDMRAHALFAKKHGFDPFKELSPDVFKLVTDTLGRGRKVNPALQADACGAQAADIGTALKLFEAGIENISVAATPANLWGLPMQLNYRRYDAMKKDAARPKPGAKVTP